ncbi:MAG: gliding motility-associated C-terminal domain-containing protein [Spirochaetes bacterium]|nr:gliding motility-associated C-terminal domain-containing protein [Spirochaetota bacterium]
MSNIKRILFFALAVFLATPVLRANTVFILNDFNDGELNHNSLGGVSSFFKNGGADCVPAIENDISRVYGRSGYSLRLDYDVSAADSYSGFWTKLDGYNLSGYNYLSFWVKGATGKEFLKVQLKVKNASDINRKQSAVYADNYMTGGMSTDWKKVIIPLDAFFNVNDLTQVDELVFVFENYQTSANDGVIKSSVYIDNIIFGTKFLGFLTIDNYSDILTPCALGGNVGSGVEGTGTTLSALIVNSVYNPFPNALKLSYSFVLPDTWAYYFMVLGGGDDLWSEIDHDLSRYNKLSFNVKADNSNLNPQGIKIEVHDTVNYGVGQPFYKIVTNAAKHIETNWQNFRIDLTNFQDFNANKLDTSEVYQVVFTFEQANAFDQSGIIYLDDIQFESSSYLTNPSAPTAPYGLTDNGTTLVDNSTLTYNSKLFVNAGSSATDPLLECIRWEYSTDQVYWTIFKIDYNVSDTVYEADLNLDNFSERSIYYIRIAAQDIYGTSSILGPVKALKFKKTGYSEERPGKLIQNLEVANNPFSPNADGVADSAEFKYTLTKTADVTVQVFDIKGALIWEKTANGQLLNTSNLIIWNGKDKNNESVRNGVYFYKISAKASDEDDKIIQVIGVIK